MKLVYLQSITWSMYEVYSRGLYMLLSSASEAAGIKLLCHLHLLFKWMPSPYFYAGQSGEVDRHPTLPPLRNWFPWSTWSQLPSLASFVGVGTRMWTPGVVPRRSCSTRFAKENAPCTWPCRWRAEQENNTQNPVCVILLKSNLSSFHACYRYGQWLK